MLPSPSLIALCQDLFKQALADPEVPQMLGLNPISEGDFIDRFALRGSVLQEISASLRECGVPVKTMVLETTVSSNRHKRYTVNMYYMEMGGVCFNDKGVWDIDALAYAEGQSFMEDNKYIFDHVDITRHADVSTEVDEEPPGELQGWVMERLPSLLSQFQADVLEKAAPKGSPARPAPRL